MRVAFSDPVGPRFWRVVPYALPFLLLALAIALGAALENDTPAIVATLLAVGSFSVLGLLPSRGALRTAEVTCGAGRITIAKAGTRSQEIEAKDIVGATTARTSPAAGKEGSVLLTLALADRPQPVTLEVEDDHAAEQIRLALGIGHGGFGTISWRTQPDTNMRSAFIGRILVVACTALMLLIAVLAGAPAAMGAAALLGQVAFIGTIIGLVGLLGKDKQPTLVMGADGLRLRTLRGWFALPYAAVSGIDEWHRALRFHVPPPFHSVEVAKTDALFGGISTDEQKILLAQVRAATQRARGYGPRKDDVEGRLEVLRRHGESPRDWLARLDLAGQMLHAGAGYRGHSFDVDDLWAILEDPEADGELRSAAARVLKHAPDARIRIDAAVAAVRDETTNKRLRIAVDDDLDAATRDLAFLDATEPPAQLAMRR